MSRQSQQGPDADTQRSTARTCATDETLSSAPIRLITTAPEQACGAPLSVSAGSLLGVSQHQTTSFVSLRARRACARTDCRVVDFS